MPKWAEERAERRVDLVEAMVEYLRGHELTGRNAIYAGCNLDDYETLGNVSLKHRVRLGGTSSSEWANILQDVYTKRLLDFYNDARPSYSLLTRRVPLRDYRRTTLLRVGEYPQLEQVGESGEVEAGAIADGGEPITLLRFARIFSLSSVAFKNNDTDLFNQTAEIAANAATFAENALFYSVLLSNSGTGPILSDGTAYFDATRGNLLAGAALDAISLGAAISALRGQRSPEGAKLNLAGRYLVVGPDNEVGARQLVTTMSPGTTRALEVVVDAHLGSEWYVLASPSQRPGFVRGFLFGDARPSVQTRIGWAHDGPEWKVSMDVAVAGFDPRAAVRNPGP